MRMLRYIPLLLFLSMVATAVSAAVVERGLGVPELGGWCQLDWSRPCTHGTASLSRSGLSLNNVSPPPRAAYEIELKLIPYDSLLFLLESPEALGHVEIYLDGVLIGRFPVIEGSWWIKLSRLPPQGVLRLELGRYCRSLTIKGVYFPCGGRPPDCGEAFRNGLLTGIAVTAAVFMVLFLILR